MIAAEGFWFVIVPMLLFIACGFIGIWRKKAWLFYPAGLFLLLWFSMMYFYRDPARPQPDVAAFVAVSDGIVDQVIHQPDGSTRIEVFLSLLDVHALRSPVSGVVSRYEFIPGEFISALKAESAESNQRINVDVFTRTDLVQFSAITGALTRRIIIDIEVGDSLLAGQRIGFVRFGSRSVLILPPNIEVVVEVGDKVYAGVTVVGTRNPEDC